MAKSNTSLCVILVVYNQAWELSPAGKSFFSFSGDVGLVVCDNSASPQSNYVPRLERFKYVHQGDNPGVSTSYNRGATIAKEWNCTHLLLLDQDTQLPENWLSVISASLEKFSEQAIFAPRIQAKSKVLSPAKNSLGRTWLHAESLPDIVNFLHYSPINSGLCIRLEDFEKAGGYNEMAKLDFSDFVFIEHLKRVGIQQFRMLNLQLQHQLSGMEVQTNASALNRFKYFCEGAKVYSEVSKNYLPRFFWTLLRAVLLTIRHKSFSFLKVFYQNFLLFNPKASTFTK